MYSKVPEIYPEELPHGDFHMGLVTDPETQGQVFQLIINSNISVYPENRRKEGLSIRDLLKENPVGIRKIEPGMGSYTVYKFPITAFSHPHFHVLLPEHRKYGPLVPVAELGLIGGFVFNINPECDSSGIAPTESNFHGIELGIGGT